MPRKPDRSIIGEIFNDLKVIELTEKRNSSGVLLYRCECQLCGGERLATKANLKRGEIKNCGCTKHDPHKSLVGRTFGNLYVKDTQVVNNALKYLCVCNLCGRETLVTPRSLKSGNTKSCGNHNKGDAARLKSLYVEGTAPCKIRNPQKLRETNTSGVTGVYWDKKRQLWAAEIIFKGKKYYLGRYADIEDAIVARKKGEEEYFEKFLDSLEGKDNKKTSKLTIGSIMTCQICGKEIIRNSPTQKYCKNCKKIPQSEYRQKYYKTHQLKEETIARKKEYLKQYQKNKYDEYVSNKDKYNDTTAYDAFKEAFPEVFKNIAEKYNISMSELATTLGLSKKTTHSWKYGIVPQLKPLMYLYRKYGAEILPTIPEVGNIERKDPIEPKSSSWISYMCADAGYSMSAISEMMHITPVLFDKRYKNSIVKPKSAVDLLCLFGYKYVDKFYPQD